MQADGIFIANNRMWRILNIYTYLYWRKVLDLNVVTKALLESDEGFSVTQSDDSLIITNDVGINAVLVVQGSQIVVESLLFPVDEVSDQAELVVNST